MSTLIVLLPPPPLTSAPEYDYVLQADGQGAGSHGRASADLLPGADHLVAVVPAQAMSWHLASLAPALTRSVLSTRTDADRVRGILSGVLEESLLDEPERLHFACFAADVAATGTTDGSASPRTPTQPGLWVAVCDREWLRAALHNLEATGRNVSHIVAECAPAANNESPTIVVSADLTPARMVVCTSSGVAVMPLHAEATPWEPANASLASTALLCAEPSVVQLCEQAFGRTAQVQTRADRLLQAAQSPWNLAQLDFSVRPADRLRKRWSEGLQNVLHAPQWRLARWSAIALVVVQVVALNALAWKQTQAIAQQKRELSAILQDTFPEVGLIIDAPVQMQRQVGLLAQSRGAAGGVNFTAALALLSTQLPAGSAPTAIELTGDSVLLSGLTLATPQVQALNQTLAAQGWILSGQGSQSAQSTQWQLRRKEAP